MIKAITIAMFIELVPRLPEMNNPVNKEATKRRASFLWTGRKFKKC